MSEADKGGGSTITEGVRYGFARNMYHDHIVNSIRSLVIIYLGRTTLITKNPLRKKLPPPPHKLNTCTRYQDALVKIPPKLCKLVKIFR